MSHTVLRNLTPLRGAAARAPLCLRAAGRKAFQRWIDRMPGGYRQSFGQPAIVGLDIATDEYCLAQLKDYRSLMPMAQEAKKPMFFLKPADGAIGGHQGAVQLAYRDFRHLAEVIIERIGGL